MPPNLRPIRRQSGAGGARPPSRLTHHPKVRAWHRQPALRAADGIFWPRPPCFSQPPKRGSWGPPLPPPPHSMACSASRPPAASPATFSWDAAGAPLQSPLHAPDLPVATPGSCPQPRPPPRMISLPGRAPHSWMDGTARGEKAGATGPHSVATTASKCAYGQKASDHKSEGGHR